MCSTDDNDKLKCKHCGRYRHTKKQCWELHGRLNDLPSCRFQRGGSGSGQGGGRFGGNRMTAYSVSSTNTDMVPNSIPSMPSGSTECSLSNDEIEALL